MEKEFIENLSGDEINGIIELARYPEWGINIESLYTQIIKYKLNISPPSYEKMRLMAEKINLSDVILEDLKNLVK